MNQPDKEIKSVFEYNGSSYEFDVRDADYAERLENALREMSDVEKTIPKDGKASESIRAQCKMIKAFFDHCIGDGAGIAVCGEKNIITEHYAAYDAFLKLVRAQKSNILNAKNVFSQYSNRQQRRANKKSHR